MKRLLPEGIVACAILRSSAFAQDYRKQAIYQIVADRFFNGSTANDNPP
jgi:hypothetical protein